MRAAEESEARVMRTVSIVTIGIVIGLAAGFGAPTPVEAQAAKSFGLGARPPSSAGFRVGYTNPMDVNNKRR